MPENNPVTEAAFLLPALDRALKNLDYGHVQIVVHDSKVVRIERVEKIHLPVLSGG